ncbi:OprD family porin [Vitreoscilla stercoraria]|nr:OprD family porin [Vitreoscilla stercoraria]
MKQPMTAWIPLWILLAVSYTAQGQESNNVDTTQAVNNTLIGENPFFSDAKVSVLNRHYYFNRDFRDGGANPSGTNQFIPINQRHGYRDEWAHGLVVDAQSGYTSGVVGLGVDAQALIGIRLDSSGAKTGTGLIPVGKDGQPSDTWSEVSGAVKAKVGETVVKYGTQMPNTPVLSVHNARLLPATSNGVSLESNDIDQLNLQAGWFTHVNAIDSTNHDDRFNTEYGLGIHAKRAGYLGATYKFTPDTQASAYYGQLKDVWHQYYLQGNHTWRLNHGQFLKVNGVGYWNRSTGQALAGDIDSRLLGANVTYGNALHSITAGYQQVFGDEPLDVVGFRTIGGNANFANAGNVAIFNEANEKSWQLRYDLNFKTLGVPGLTFTGRYIKGFDMDNRDSQNAMYRNALRGYTYKDGDSHWERDLELRYEFQHGKAKGLNLRIRQATLRGSAGYRYGNMDEIRVIVEYPWSL